MSYFVTGATGFIGRFLTEKLLERNETVYVMVRESSLDKITALKEKCGDDRNFITPIIGDLSKPALGIGKEDLQNLKGKIKHFFHVAAIYDLTTPYDEQIQANVEGTQHALDFAKRINAGMFHHTSSIAAAGFYEGEFAEDMYEEAGNLSNPYFISKHLAEGIVRDETDIPWRIYRPGVVVGHSETGEMDKVDGPYFIFRTMEILKNIIPKQIPLIGIDSGRMNIVPVDFVVNAMDYIAHNENVEEKCFHIVGDKSYPIGQLIDLSAKVAEGHRFFYHLKLAGPLVKLSDSVLRRVQKYERIRAIQAKLTSEFQIPFEVIEFLYYPTTFSNKIMHQALEGSGIQPPELESYIDNLWAYWEAELSNSSQ